MKYDEMEQEIRRLREELRTNAAILAETRRSEDRLQKSEDRLFRLVVGVVVVLIGANLWYNYKVYNRDIQDLRDDVTKRVEEARSELVKEHKATMEQQFKELKEGLLSDNAKSLKQFQLEINKYQVEGFAYTLGYVADIRLFLRDVEGAVWAGLELFDNATRSNTNYQAHALDKLTNALQIGTQDQKRIPDELLSQVQKLLERSDVTSDPRLSKLQQTLQSYRAALRT